MSRTSSSAIRCWSATGDERRRAAAPGEPNERRRRFRTAQPTTGTGRTSDRRRGEPSRKTRAERRPRQAVRTMTDAGSRRAPTRRRRRAIPNGRGVGPAAPRRRRLQSRSLRLGRDDARRPSRRAARARDRRSGAPHDRPVSDRSGRRGRLSDRRSGARSPRSSAPRRREVEAVLGDPAELRSARRLRAQSHRMPRHPAQGARPLRSGDAGAGRASRSAGQARPRRRCARSAASSDEDLDRHDRAKSASSIRSPASPSARRWCSRSCRTSSCGPAPDGGWHGRAQLRHAAEGAGQPELLRRGRRARRKNDKDKSYLADCLQTATWLVRALDQRAKTILKVVDRDRAPAGRLLRPRRAASAAAQSQDRRRRDQHARIDGLARHRQQIHGDQPRHLRAEIFLHLGDRRRPTAARRIRRKRCATASSS